MIDVYKRAGAYAALTGEPRRLTVVGEKQHTSSVRIDSWYEGFDEARKRLHELEGELVRGEVPEDG